MQATKIKKYDKYKVSGIEWIREIPQHWEVEQLKNLYNFGKGLSITKDALTENGIPVISYGQIHSKTNTGTHISDDLIRFVPENYLENNSQSLVNKGDFIFADTSEDIEGAGNCVFVDKEMTLFAGYHSIILRNKLFDYIFGKYLSYLFKTIQWRAQVRSRVNGIKVYSISQKILKEITVVVPKQQEQQAIADYLDKKCREIDKVVETEKAVIEKLKEYKQSIITEVVTKGLDKSVPLKDSGIEWIGKIPQHWKIEKLKFISECNKEVLSENTESSKTIDYIEIGSVTNENGINDHQTFTFENAPSRARRIVKHGDTIISTVRTYLKAIAYIDEQYDNYICSTGFAVFTPSSKILPKFLFHALHSEWFVSTVEANSVGISYPAINTTNIVNYKIAIPSVKEQEQILKYLDKKCSEIDKAITGKEQLIEKLTEYKKSLIYECVTGKRKVAD